MRQLLVFILTCLTLTAAAAEGENTWPALSQGQSAMARSFISMPAALTPYVTTSMREDMVDFYAVGSKKGVANLLMGESSLEEITDTTFTVKLSSEKSTLSVRKYITVKGDSLYAVISTVAIPSADSSIKFFDSQWNMLDADRLFTPPTLSSFTPDPKDKAAKKALENIPFTLLGLSFTPDGQIAARISTDYLPDEIKATTAPYITRTPILYKWNGKRFVVR